MPTNPTAKQPADVSIQISKPVHRQLKRIAFESERNIKRVVNDALTEWLNTRTAEVQHG